MDAELAALREEVSMLRGMMRVHTSPRIKEEDGVSIAEWEGMSPVRPAELASLPKMSPQRGRGDLIMKHGEATRVDRENGEVEALWIRLGMTARLASKKRDISFYGKPYGNVLCVAVHQILTEPDSMVETVNLGCTNITHEGLAVLGTALRSRAHSLKVLKLNGNPLVGDAGVAILMKTISPFISTLELGDCGVTSQGVFAVTSTLPLLPNFKHLYLYCNPEIGDLGAAHFAESVGAGYELETLNLQNCGVSADARRWLLSASIQVTF